MTDAAALDALREAARLSPDNPPLRRLLAERLLTAGLLAEAETEFQAALLLAPGDAGIVTGLAEAFVRQGKHGAALAALESLPDLPPRAGVVAARALVAEGDLGAANQRYWTALAADPSLADPELAARLVPGVAEPLPVQAPPVEIAAETERPRTTFADVAGMEAVKETLRMKLLLPVQRPELFAAYGKRAGGGVLLYGPPGCGKTHLARAAAGELGAAFIDVGLADILDMYVGSSERNLKAIFEQARARRPCVLFFDEVDALAARRADMRAAHNRQIVNQFLAELDGVDDEANEGVLVLAATNAPWYIDVAFRRPGRFDQMVFVPPPDLHARAAILALQLRDKPLGELDFLQVAKATDWFVGADLAGIVDRAVEAKLHESLRAGHPLPLHTADLLAAAKAVRPSVVREWLATARNYVMHSNESGVWDELRPWLDRR
ncbi:cell division protein [Actinomadura craniellae]|uniref:Cell division protein n=1 Tax=Actinomadura craniellae TaxID=2231787 RepID=A0A365H437_9ACTN|nr:AAA family ATPase [Actinomadura craniellae]RAY13778.1 cell division protein [Actinomadura craniellae]